jgi:hypothetical protein
MSNIKAFPTTKPLDSWDDPNQGMDLRDYFAAKAMNYWLCYPIENMQIQKLCRSAYQVADAMMEERKLCSDTK